MTRATSLFLGLTAAVFSMFTPLGCATSPDNEVAAADGELGSAPAPDPHPASPPKRTVVELAVDSPELATLVEAVLKADLAGALGQDGPFTVFAPTNGAFGALGIDPAQVDAKVLSAVLLDHVVPGALSARKLRRLARTGERVETLGGLKLSFERGPLAVNDLPIRFRNRHASNGVIHVIDGVLLEGGVSIADQVKLRASLSTLLDAVVRADLADTLANDGPFTVFAPTNGAFAAYGIDPNTLEVDGLKAVLLDHVVEGTFSRRDLLRKAWRGESLVTLGGLKLKLSRSGRVNGLDLVGEAGANNGSIQVLNGVLLE